MDAGFAFEPERRIHWPTRLGVGSDERLVGVTARRWLTPAAPERYERELARTIDAVQATGARVILIPQVSTDYPGDDDRICERRIAGRCTSGPLMVDEVVDYRDLKGLYDECTLHTGTRFHSVIFSLNSDVLRGHRVRAQDPRNHGRPRTQGVFFCGFIPDWRIEAVHVPRQLGVDSAVR